jgi:hypothetical protein
VTGIAIAKDPCFRRNAPRTEQLDAARGDRFGLRTIGIRPVGRRWMRSPVPFALMFELAQGAITICAPYFDAFEMRRPRNRVADQTFIVDAVQRESQNRHVSSVIS